MSLGALAVSVYVDHTGIDTGARAAIVKLEQFGRTLQQRGLSQIFVGISLAIPFKKAIEDMAAFDRQMRLVATVTKDTAKYIGQYTEAVKQMAFEFGESTATISKGLYDILSSQIDEAHALDVLRVALKGAIGGMTDTAVAADATVAMLNSYRLSAEYATDVSDWLFKTVELGTITYEQLASRIGYVASSAYACGVSLEDLGAAIATITHVGLPAESAIVAINNILKQFMNPSKEAVDVARQLGFEMNTATIRAWGLKGVFERLKNVDAETISSLFPDIRGLRGAIPAIQAITEYAKFMDGIADRAGAAENAFRKMTEENPLWLLLKRMSQSIIAISRAIGEALAPEISKLSSKLFDITDNVVNFIKSHRWLVVTLAAVSAAIIVSGMSLITMGIGLRVVALAARSVDRVIKGIWKSLLFLVSPLGLVTVAVSLLGVAFYNVVNAMGRGDTFVKKLGDLLKRAYDALPRISDVWQSIIRFGGAVFRGFIVGVRLFVTAIQVAISAVVGFVENGVSAIGRFFANLASSIREVVVGVADPIISVFRRIVNNPIVRLRLELYGLIRDIGRWFATTYLWVLGIFVEQAPRLLGRLLSVVVDFAIHSANPILKFLLAQTWAFIQGAIQYLYDRIKRIVSAARTVFGGLVGAVEDVLHVIASVFDDVLGVLGDNWKSFWLWMDDVVTKIFSHGRDSLVEDLKYLELAFKRWRDVGELAVTQWAYAVTKTFNKVSNTAISIHKKAQALFTDWIADKIYGVPKEIRDQELQRAWAAASAPVPEGELEKGLRLRVAELEKALGEKWGKDLTPLTIPKLPNIPEWEKKDVPRVPRKVFDDFLGGQGGMFSTKESLPTLAERGTAEAYSIITKQDPMTETAKNTKDMVAEQKKTNKLLRDQMQQRKTDPYGAPLNLGLTP
ncbi:MAG TPA: phage tail tape measure protein [Bacillota bacterium]|nr:phage tail tape measure protein [Bacillota bacterium]